MAYLEHSQTLGEIDCSPLSVELQNRICPHYHAGHRTKLRPLRKEELEENFGYVNEEIEVFMRHSVTSERIIRDLLGDSERAEQCIAAARHVCTKSTCRKSKE